MNLAAAASPSNVVRLREYQQRGIEEVKRQYAEPFDGHVVVSWENGQRAVRRESSQTAERKVLSVVLVMPTGAGKGTVAQQVLSDAVRKGRRAIFIAPRREIVKDVCTRIQSGGVRAGVILADHYADRGAPVQVCSVQTLFARRKELPPASLVVWDEAHHANASSYQRIRDAYPNARHLGLTATPLRADDEPIGDVFDRMVIAASTADLIRERHLVPMRFYRPGRFLGNDLAQDPVDAYLTLTPKARAFVFVHSVPAADRLAKRFSERGVPAASIVGDTPIGYRDMVLDEFRRGNIRAIVNVATMTEGVDVPEADACILARPDPLGLYLQKCGRALRLSRGKRFASIVDLCGNYYLHGKPDEPYREDQPLRFSLRRLKKEPQRRGSRELSESACPICGAMNASWFVFAHFGEGCKSCGFKHAPPAEPVVVGDDLIEEDAHPVGQAAE